MQRAKSSRARSSFTHRKRQRTPSAVDPIPDAVAEHESPHVDMALPAAGAESQPAVIGTLKQVAPLLWDDNYMARFEEEADQLERRWGLMTAAKELKAKAPESSYAARGLIQNEENHSVDEWFRELQMANAAVRQANQQLHTFTVCARSISCLLHRMPEKDWKREVKSRTLLSKPTAIALLNEMMRVRPPPAFATNTALQAFIYDQTYAKKGASRGQHRATEHVDASGNLIDLISTVYINSVKVEVPLTLGDFTSQEMLSLQNVSWSFAQTLALAATAALTAARTAERLGKHAAVALGRRRVYSRILFTIQYSNSTSYYPGVTQNSLSSIRI